MSTEIINVGTCIAGAGIIGLAVARALAGQEHKLKSRSDIWLLEREPQIAVHSSSRNSEVIHAGLYYPPDSLKARYCLRGRKMLYDYCKSRKVPYRLTGKLVVAQADELDSLEALHLNALNSGLESADLELLERSEIRHLEPSVHADAALFSRRTGIIDSHQLMDTLLHDAREGGANFVANCTVEHILPGKGHFDVTVRSGSGPSVTRSILRCQNFINCAGFRASELAGQIEGFPEREIPTTELVKGSYFSYRGQSPFRHLVYPLPATSGPGLGIHATIDMAGNVRFGPDAQVIDTVDYRVDETRKAGFVAAIRRYYPELDCSRLQPDYAGIRSRVACGDFVITDGARQGMPGLIQLFGIESPGLTASLALAEAVAERLDQYC